MRAQSEQKIAQAKRQQRAAAAPNTRLTCFNSQDRDRDPPVRLLRDVQKAGALRFRTAILEPLLAELDDVGVRCVRDHEEEVDRHAEIDEEVDVEEGSVDDDEGLFPRAGTDEAERLVS